MILYAVRPRNPPQLTTGRKDIDLEVPEENVYRIFTFGKGFITYEKTSTDIHEVPILQKEDKEMVSKATAVNNEQSDLGAGIEIVKSVADNILTNNAEQLKHRDIKKGLKLITGGKKTKMSNIRAASIMVKENFPYEVTEVTADTIMSNRLNLLASQQYAIMGDLAMSNNYALLHLATMLAESDQTVISLFGEHRVKDIDANFTRLDKMEALTRRGMLYNAEMKEDVLKELRSIFGSMGKKNLRMMVETLLVRDYHMRGTLRELKINAMPAIYSTTAFGRNFLALPVSDYSLLKADSYKAMVEYDRIRSQLGLAHAEIIDLHERYGASALRIDNLQKAAAMILRTNKSLRTSNKNLRAKVAMLTEQTAIAVETELEFNKRKGNQINNRKNHSAYWYDKTSKEVSDGVASHRKFVNKSHVMSSTSKKVTFRGQYVMADRVNDNDEVIRVPLKDEATGVIFHRPTTIRCLTINERERLDSWREENERGLYSQPRGEHLVELKKSKLRNHHSRPFNVVETFSAHRNVTQKLTFNDTIATSMMVIAFLFKMVIELIIPGATKNWTVLSRMTSPFNPQINLELPANIGDMDLFSHLLEFNGEQIIKAGEAINQIVVEVADAINYFADEVTKLPAMIFQPKAKQIVTPAIKETFQPNTSINWNEWFEKYEKKMQAQSWVNFPIIPHGLKEKPRYTQKEWVIAVGQLILERSGYMLLDTLVYGKYEHNYDLISQEAVEIRAKNNWEANNVIIVKPSEPKVDVIKPRKNNVHPWNEVEIVDFQEVPVTNQDDLVIKNEGLVNDGALIEPSLASQESTRVEPDLIIKAEEPTLTYGELPNEIIAINDQEVEELNKTLSHLSFVKDVTNMEDRLYLIGGALDKYNHDRFTVLLYGNSVMANFAEVASIVGPFLEELGIDAIEYLTCLETISQHLDNHIVIDMFPNGLNHAIALAMKADLSEVGISCEMIKTPNRGILSEALKYKVAANNRYEYFHINDLATQVKFLRMDAQSTFKDFNNVDWIYQTTALELTEADLPHPYIGLVGIYHRSELIEPEIISIGNNKLARDHKERLIVDAVGRGNFTGQKLGGQTIYLPANLSLDAKRAA